ncbi:MAG: carbon-nitrogen hydrolase family protein, partial [Candidatus Poribacteria bacterium]|nr:carbon-nitrogen hydrolase family protein [Candidatus Poribacteria bacterium]
MSDTTVRVAAVQMDVELGNNAGNRKRILDKLSETAGNGAQLVVFPEAAFGGYCFSSLSDSEPFAESADGETAQRFSERCQELGVTGV